MLTQRIEDVYTFDKAALIPAEWQDRFPTGHLVFNPTIVERPGGYAMCYRVAPPEATFRALATCQLDKDFKVVEGSVTPFSDLITFARPDIFNERALTWHADPRYQRVGDDIYLTWNDGGNRPYNHQFIMKMDANGIRPVGKARELVLYGMPRRITEKNWMLFEANDQVFAVYSCSPHIILSVDFESPDEVACYPFSSSTWDNEYSTIFGVMRGSAQPVRRTSADGKETFLSIIHSSFKLPEGRRYELAAYEYETKPPFRVLRSVTQPIELSMGGIDGFEFDRLNKEVYSVVYPCGLVLEGDEAVISYGINDENLAITRLPVDRIEQALVPVATTEESMLGCAVPRGEPTAAPAGLFGTRSTRGVPLFWWDAVGKKFDGDMGERRFKIGNFGDIASRDIFERISGVPTLVPQAKRRKILSVGSILHQARQGDVIWGSGIKGTMRALPDVVTDLDIRAVRGPLTLEFLREKGFNVSKVAEVFDPGCLMGHLYAKEIAAYDVARNKSMGPFRIIPHYRDDLMMRRRHKDLQHSFLTVDCTPQQMVERMLGAEAVYSSSLHGVIFAESLGIPAYWLKSVGGENDYKFYDYYYGTGRYQVKCFDTLQDAMRGTPMPLPTLRPEAYLATFPHDLLSGLGAETSGLRPGMEFQPVSGSETAIEQVMGWAPEAVRIGPHGFWLLGETSGCGICLSLGAQERVTLVLTLRPFNHPALPSPQEIELTVAGRLRYNLAWPKGDIESRQIRVPVTGRMLEDHFLRIESKARHALSPASLNVGLSPDPLTVCIQKIELAPAFTVSKDGGEG